MKMSAPALNKIHADVMCKHCASFIIKDKHSFQSFAHFVSVLQFEVFSVAQAVSLSNETFCHAVRGSTTNFDNVMTQFIINKKTDA